MTRPTDAHGAVVACVDGSESGWRALDWAHHEALRIGRPMLVVHASGRSDSPRGYDDPLRDAVARLADLDSPVPLTTLHASASLHDALMRLAQHAYLIAMGASSRSHSIGSAVHRVGHAGLRVLGRAACPVVVVPLAGPDRREGVITVGLSCTVGGLSAMRFACREALASDRRILAVRAWADPDWLADPVAGNYTSYDTWTAIQSATMSGWHKHVRAEFGDAVEAKLTARLTAAPVYWALEEGAKQSSLMVLGARRDRNALLPATGPIVAWAVHHAPCPVAVVPHDAAVGAAAQKPVHDAAPSRSPHLRARSISPASS